MEDRYGGGRSKPYNLPAVYDSILGMDAQILLWVPRNTHYERPSYTPFIGPQQTDLQEIYKNGVSNKVNNVEQLTNKLGILIKKNKASKNLEDKIDKLGKRILKKTVSEIEFYLNKKWM